MANESRILDSARIAPESVHPEPSEQGVPFNDNPACGV